MTKAVELAQQASTGVSEAFKNRIINGAMVIDQRNAGASVTPVSSAITYTLDRWGFFPTQASKFTVQQNAGSVTPPVGFTNYLGVTSSSAYSVTSGDVFQFFQHIEGFNTADLQWGTANAKTVTLSFWVRSSLTGTFGGALTNGAANRSYPYTYTISAANTWEYKTVTVAGDTSGTWVGATNGNGMRVRFGVGVGSTFSGPAGAWAGVDYVSATGAVSVVGTSGATLYITGVQLEVGSSATSFEYRQYGTELALCQRYYEKSYNTGTIPATGLANGWYGFTGTSLTENTSGIYFRVTKRGAPTMVVYNAITGASGAAYRVSDAASITATLDRIGENGVGVVYLASGSTNTYYYHWAASSEL
jgi:hypothetical protein